MRTALLLLVLLVTGPGLLILGFYSLRHRAWRESVPALELLIDRTIGVAPPPRTAWDRRLARFQCWANIVRGSLFSLYLIIVILSFVF